jgi:hypothetical protein
MNPIAIIILIAFFLLIVWAGRVGLSGLYMFFQKRMRQIFGVSLIALATFMTIKGAWQIACIPLTLGCLLLNSRRNTSIVGLIERYFDRSFSIRHTNLHNGADTRSSNMRASSTIMTKEEAYQILGLEPAQFKTSEFQDSQLQDSQLREAITAAYRRAMKKAHPDQGGSSDLAVRLNLARDILLA